MTVKNVLSTRQKNKEVNRLVRNFLLDKRMELQVKVSRRRHDLKMLADEQRKNKAMLADINRQIDELGVRINEDKK